MREISINIVTTKSMRCVECGWTTISNQWPDVMSLRQYSIIVAAESLIWKSMNYYKKNLCTKSLSNILALLRSVLKLEIFCELFSLTHRKSLRLSFMLDWVQPVAVNQLSAWLLDGKNMSCVFPSLTETASCTNTQGWLNKMRPCCYDCVTHTQIQRQTYTHIHWLKVHSGATYPYDFLKPEISSIL